MKSYINFFFGSLVVVTTIASSAFAQNATTWTDGGGTGSWTNDSNWSNGIPINSTAVTFANPISVVGVDTGSATTIASITVSAGTDAFQLVPGGIADSLIVNGSFLNNSSNAVEVNLGYTVGASSTLDGPINFNGSVNVDLRTATIAGAVNLNSSVVLQLNNTTGTGYGRFSVGSGATLTFGGGPNSVSFSPSSTYTGVNGNVFTLVSNSGGTVTGLNASLFDVSTLPTLTGGLAWDTSNLGSGVLAVVVPEPSTWLLLTAGLTTVVVFRRRRRN